MKSWNFSLAGLLLFCLFAAFLLFVVIKRDQWAPEGNKSSSLIDLLPSAWVKDGKWPSLYAPDGVRILDAHDGAMSIYEKGKPALRLYDFAHEGGVGAEGMPYGFIDDDHLVFELDIDGKRWFAVHQRRFPEWWWGHFYRPEVWLAIIFGSLWLWCVIHWFRTRKVSSVHTPPRPPTPDAPKDK